MSVYGPVAALFLDHEEGEGHSEPHLPKQSNSCLGGKKQREKACGTGIPIVLFVSICDSKALGADTHI